LIDQAKQVAKIYQSFTKPLLSNQPAECISKEKLEDSKSDDESKDNKDIPVAGRRSQQRL